MTKNKALELRKVNEWSLSKLSRLLFSEKGVYVAPTTLNNFERGKNELYEPFRKELADLYGVSLSYLDGIEKKKRGTEMLKDKQKDKFIEIRRKELTAESGEFKNHYIASLELFLNDLLSHFENEVTDSDDASNFFCEYFGLMHNDALELIKKLESEEK